MQARICLKIDQTCKDKDSLLGNKWGMHMKQNYNIFSSSLYKEEEYLCLSIDHINQRCIKTKPKSWKPVVMLKSMFQSSDVRRKELRIFSDRRACSPLFIFMGSSLPISLSIIDASLLWR